MATLNPDVAQTSPALYSAAYYGNLNSAQINQVNQISSTVGLNKELMGLATPAAQDRYSKLDPHLQEQLKAMYGEAAYVPKPKTFEAPTSPGAVWHDAWNIGKGVAGAVLSPFRLAFKAAGEYNRVINTPYLIYRQVSQGDPMSWNVVRNAWDGTNVFDNKMLSDLHDHYGDTDTFVAMHALKGMKPGEIVDAYGKVNSEIIASVTKMITDPKNFENMLNQFKGAQVSYGRDAARMLFSHQLNDPSLYSSSKWNKVSGAIDAVAQIVTDPLTWLTGGTSKLATRGERLAELMMKDPTTNVAKVFARNDVQNTWNKAGALIENIAKAEAAGDKSGRIIARDELRRQMPDLNNDSMVNLLVKEKVFNPKAAEDFFTAGDNMMKLVAGRVDGTTFYRSGIPLAKRTHSVTSGLNRVLGDFFNGALEKDVLDKVGPKFVEDLRKVGIENDAVHASQTPMLEEITGQLSNFKRRLGRMAARFPGSDEIHITDGEVNKSLPVVKNLARTIYPRAYAEYFAETFRTAGEEDRVLLLKSLYIQIMHNMGLHGTEGGEKLMQQILQDKFASTAGFSSKRVLDVSPEYASSMLSRGVLEAQPAENVGGMLQTSIDGTLHPFQAKPTIGNLPWHGKDGEASLADYGFNFNKGAKIRAVMDAAGGITRKNFVTKMMDNWSTATLFPRLGIRSAIDESFMYAMMAPGKQLLKWAEGRKLNKAIIAFSGDDTVIPPIKRAILNLLDKNPANFVSDEKRFITQKINGEEIRTLEKPENIAHHAKLILETLNNDQHMEYMYQAMIHHPEIANAMVNSIIGKSGLGSTLGGGELASMLVSNSHLTNMFRELGFLRTGRYEEKSVADLAKINESLVTAAHYENWFMRFTRNGRDYGKGNVNFGTIFVKNHALRDTKDFERARSEILDGIGIDPVTLNITNRKVLDNYLKDSQQFVRDKADGYTPVESAVRRVEHQLFDMRNTFHGGAIPFNDRLLEHINDVADMNQAAREGMSRNKALTQALNSVDYKTFVDKTKGFGPIDKITTDIGMSDGTNESALQKMSQYAADLRQHSMEWMDAQNNHLFRQPALWATYANFRDRYAQVEAKFVADLIKGGMSKEMATHLGEKKFAETAMSHAANYMLKSIDNPQIRSNLAWSLRTTGRFYRATEDFYRRVFRMKDITPQILYRMRMAHLGLQSNGFIHPDQNGDPYVIMPADNIIFHAINGTMGALTGNPDVVKQPMFNDFAVKIAMGNPSFQQDAGQPSLSGPFIALPVLAMKNLLGNFGGNIGDIAAANIDKTFLGNVSQNLTLRKAIVPAFFDRLWSALSPDEQNQQFVSAGMQAIAYNAAHGYGLSPEKLAKLDPSDKSKAVSDNLKNVRITTHNILFMRGMLGLMSPVSPTMQESQGIPDYLKNVGINGLRPEFADILQSIMRNSKGDIQDPYEAALMTFTGKYPGKLVYTVARDTKAVNVLLNKTSSLKSWMLANGSKLNEYKSGAGLVFAPNVGQYDSNVYTWMQASGMLQQRTLEDYYNEVSIAQDRQKYYDLRTQAEEELKNPVYTSTERQYIIDAMKGSQQQLKLQNPYLDEALNSKSFGIGKQQAMFDDLQGIVKDASFPISAAQRQKMSTAVAIVRNAIDGIKNMGVQDDIVNGGQAKQELKQRVLAALRELGGAQGTAAPTDPVMQEAMRSIFNPLLDYYVRNTQKVTG